LCCFNIHVSRWEGKFKSKMSSINKKPSEAPSTEGTQKVFYAAILGERIIIIPFAGLPLLRRHYTRVHSSNDGYSFFLFLSLRTLLSEAIRQPRYSCGKPIFADCHVSRPTSSFGILAMTITLFFYLPPTWTIAASAASVEPSVFSFRKFHNR
jgi:hypothetical protein